MNDLTSLTIATAREGLRKAYLQAHVAGNPAGRCQAAVGKLGAWTRGGLSRRAGVNTRAPTRRSLTASSSRIPMPNASWAANTQVSPGEPANSVSPPDATSAATSTASPQSVTRAATGPSV